ncbi:MAG: hypothetical protein WC758_05945 [Candidatus Woesearchaeota archaeon]|jgi:hypothetical protein
MKNKLMVGILAVFIVSALAFTGLTYAYKGNTQTTGPNYNEDVHEQLENAMDVGDYDAWIKIRQDNNLPMNGRMFQVVNKANFAKYVEMHDANEAENYVRAEEIRTELGLGQGMQSGKGMNSKGTGTGSIKTGCASQGSCAGAGMHSSSNVQSGARFLDANNDGICDNY